MTFYPPKVPDPPSYLDATLRERWAELAPQAVRRGTLGEATADAFARYLIAEQEYLRATQCTLYALRTGNSADAGAWSAVQDRLQKQLTAAGKAFGFTPD